MGSQEKPAAPKPHAVFVPYPAQGHINPMMKLAKLLHSRGFHITFVNTEFNHRRRVRSLGPAAAAGLPGFCFETIPDGLPHSDLDATQDIPALCASTRKHSLAPFRDLLSRLQRRSSYAADDDDDEDVPPVTCVVSGGAMSFTVYAAEELGIPELLFFTTSACGFLSYLSFAELVRRGYTPLKDESYLTNGYLDTPVDGIAGMEGVRLRDLPSFIRTTDPDDIMVNINIKQSEDAPRAHGIILNTFEELESGVLAGIRRTLPNVYTVGPLSPLCRRLPDGAAPAVTSTLWREDDDCLRWLDGQEEASVVYVNFGSITVVTPRQLAEFAWGLANSMHPFLWVIRPDMVRGEGGGTAPSTLPEGFAEATAGRGRLAGWCDQEGVLAHPATGGFLTHCGWNSTLEGLHEGVPLACWPFFAEQRTNCRYACLHWGVAMEMEGEVTREGVEGLVRELMGAGEKGRGLRKRPTEWRGKAREAISPGGSSHRNLERLIRDMVQWSKHENSN